MHNLDDIIQNLLSVDWQTQFSFLHIPKIESLAKDITIRALVVAGGSEVAKSLGLAITDPVPLEPDLQGSAQSADIETGRSDPKVEPDDPGPDTDLLSAEEIGFTTSVVGVDPRVRPPSTQKSKIDFIDPDDEPVDMTPVEPEDQKIRKPENKNLHPKRAFVFPVLKLPKISFPRIKFNLKSSNPIWWILGVGLIGLGLLIFYFVWILPSAVVTVRVTPKILEENVELTLSSSESSIDFAGRIVPSSIEFVSESGEKLTETTGKKIVGEPAKGQVTIYNRTSAAKTFAKGTQLAVGSLKFTLDSDVSVASKSAGSDYVDVPGKATVPIVASAIGVDHNIPSGTEFVIASFGKDSYVGKNDESLAGGTSEEVQVVGKDDQKNLVKALTEELLLSIAAKSTGTSTPGTGVYLIPDSSVVDAVTYSAKVGETAKTLTVNLTIKASLLKYKTEDVTTLVNSSIDSAVPMGYIRANLPSTVDLTASMVEGNDNSVKGNAKVKVALLPVIDKIALQSSIKGKSASALASILASSIPGYLNAEVKIHPSWIPTRLKRIPQNPSRITVQITPAL